MNIITTILVYFISNPIQTMILVKATNGIIKKEDIYSRAPKDSKKSNMPFL
jgi:multisubunit Na+/H+ antiporter MnhG subunit